MAFPTVTRLIPGDPGYDDVTHDSKLITILATKQGSGSFNWPLLEYRVQEITEEGFDGIIRFVKKALDELYTALAPEKKYRDLYSDPVVNPWRNMDNDVKGRPWDLELTQQRGYVDYKDLAKTVAAALVAVGVLSKLSPSLIGGLMTSHKLRKFRSDTKQGMADIMAAVSAEDVTSSDIFDYDTSDFSTVSQSPNEMIAMLAQAFARDDIGSLSNLVKYVNRFLPVRVP
jgi:hypothetical protein